MIAQHWTTWLTRFRARDVAREGAPPVLRDWSNAYAVEQHVEIRDVPVFDQCHRQVGSIPCRADILDDLEVTPASWMSHCMNDPVSWLQQELDAGEMSRLVGTANLHRVPLVDKNNQVFGVVVLEAGIRTRRERVASSLDHRADSAFDSGH